MLRWPPKDPDEVLDYDIDWTARLGADTIASSSWIIDSGSVVAGTTENSESIAKIWLSGGTLNEICLLTNRIVTTGGRTMDQSVKFNIRAK